MRYTTKKVLQTKEALLGIVGMSDLAEAAGMLTAYAALLERSEAGVTADIVKRAAQSLDDSMSRAGSSGSDDMDWGEFKDAVRIALLAVWPVADSKPSVQEEMSHKDAVINLIAAIWSIDSLRNRCRSDIDALREWLNREPSAEPTQPADSGRVRDEIDPRVVAAFNAIGDWAGPKLTDAIESALAAQGQPAERTPDVQAMVNRFLGWALPKDFAPDAGISFNPGPTQHLPHCWPVGTNLFTAAQATAMVEYMLAAPQPGEPQ